MIIFHRLHFDIDPSAPSPFSCSYTPSNVFCDSPNPSSPSDLTNIDGSSGSSGFYGSQHLNSSAANTNSITGLPQQPRQKGRPRKRKPKDIEAMTANLGELQSYLLAFLHIQKHGSSEAFSSHLLLRDFYSKNLLLNIFFVKQWDNELPSVADYLRIFLLVYFTWEFFWDISLWEHFFALKSQFSYERISFIAKSQRGGERRKSCSQLIETKNK